MSFRYLYCKLCTHFTHCLGISFVDFKQVNSCWELVGHNDILHADSSKKEKKNLVGSGQATRDLPAFVKSYKWNPLGYQMGSVTLKALFQYIGSCRLFFLIMWGSSHVEFVISYF